MVVLPFLIALLLSILAVLYRIRSQWYKKYKQNLAHLNPEQIYHHLVCSEFPFECFYGINLAFYRTFVSPTIANVYTQTKTLENETEKRVNDTDIFVHAWIDYGFDSEESQASFKQLNRIHAAFSNRTRNQDFVFILCSLIVDTIRVIDVFGWRPLSDIENQAIFHFYEQVGKRMNLNDRPVSLEHAHRIVHDYMESDIESMHTKFGGVLTDAITKVVEKWYSLLMPASLVRSFLHAIILIVGGETFIKKLGLKRPSVVTVYVLYTLATVRRCFMHFMPPRRDAHHLSDILMNKDYMCPAAKADFLQVGPPKVIGKFNKHQD